jgi:N-acetyl-anhydromuramyl-L-alanine amidase AmpD
MASILDIQRRLIELGYNLGHADGYDGPQTRAAIKQFQRAHNLAADGVVGPRTLAVLFPVPDAPEKPNGAQRGSVVPAEWMPRARMDRIIVHWTAGQHKASGLDRSHYHILIEGDGKLVRGIPSIALNEAPAKKGYAAHTRGCNSGSMGVSLCCMASAREHPFWAGTAPMTREQWEMLPHVLADLCRRYGVPITPRTVLSHAEVEKTLGIRQAGKWDIARIPFDGSLVGARQCGEAFRGAAEALL